ncbi:hypothetical protein AC579_10427 [Pseudocercospora musae]|uniref:Glutamate decarboxylase n=1 Tax=Pseudocercospora musae TaxID=113226 RepID=A0A139GT72_9PEZI|nr:hypothetical protein AC579_10427 [Pseudocercospora musae]
MTADGTATTGEEQPLQRAKEAEELLGAVQNLVTSFIQAADENATSNTNGHSTPVKAAGDHKTPTLLEHQPPQQLQQLLACSLPQQGLGRDGFIEMVQKLFRYSVNIWDQGFLDKLYATITPVGLAADMVLSSLNTNLHVYQVSPALTIIEKQTGRALASMFGLNGANAGGITQPGGSAANQSSMVIARNNLFPETKLEGNGNRRFVLFTSAHGHYSVEKAAQMFGFGSKAVRAVDIDIQGRMKPGALDIAIQKSKDAGETPFYVNATAGTTVLGSFDPIDEISAVCKTHNLWLHVDGSWGGSIIFSEKQRHRLKGSDKADSISICPHKMLNVPLTCSFLLGKDLRQFHKGMTLPAGYLFHDSDDVENGTASQGHSAARLTGDSRQEYWDLADLTPQCGRRGDSLKLALSWIYYGTEGLRDYVDHAFDIAAELASIVGSSPDFTLVSESPPPCLQVCFYFRKQADADANSRTTEKMTKELISKGFMIDYAPGDDGKFFRVVVNGQTRRDTVVKLVNAIIEQVASQELVDVVMQ